MLAVWCLVFAAVAERLALSAGSRRLGRDASVLGWVIPVEQGDASDTTPEVTYPKRLVQQIESEEEIVHGHLDTKVRNNTDVPLPLQVYLAHSAFQIEAFGHVFTLDLELNHQLLSSDYVERHFDRDGKPAQSVGGEHCYYQGRLRGLPASWAALSTCHGLRGMFSDGHFSYGIEPAANGSNQDDGAHLIRRMPDVRLSPGERERPDPTGTRGGMGGEDEDEDDGGAEERKEQPSGPPRRSKRQVRRPTVQSETKYIELMVVNDHEMFVQFRRSTTQTRNFAKAVVNMADAIYKEQLNTRIVLVAMETWSTTNLVPVVADPLATLQNFMRYRRESVREPSDAVHLFSGRTFQSSRSGTAYTGGICSPAKGGGINEFGNVGAMAITLCQSLGQNIGMRWNNIRNAAGDCKCPDAWLGCIMEDTG